MNRLTALTARTAGVTALLCSAALVGGLFIGRATKTTVNAPGTEHSSVDVGFVRDMMVHHDQAVVMAASELWRGESSSVRQEALDILLAQRGEYVQMAERLDGWGVASAEPDGKAMGWMGMSVKVEDMPGLATAVLMDRTQETEIAEMRRFGNLMGVEIPDPGVLMTMPDGSA